MNKLLMLGLSALALTLSLPAAAEGDKSAGKAKSAVCAGCHGVDGNSTNPEWPKLAGQHEDYIVKQLQEFKSKVRDNATMYPQAAALSDQDMADLAAYFASQTPKPGIADEKVVKLGETLFRGGSSASGLPACTGCHGPNGAGNPLAKFPSLAGQHATYTANQLKAFRAGVRANDAGKMMRMISTRLTDPEIEALAQYISGLQ